MNSQYAVSTHELQTLLLLGHYTLKSVVCGYLSCQRPEKLSAIGLLSLRTISMHALAV